MSLNYGFEIEFFLANSKPKQIFNATKLIANYLQTDKLLLGNKGNPFAPMDLDINPVLQSNNLFNIIADGTAFEIVGKEIACHASMKSGLAVDTLNHWLKIVRNYLTTLYGYETLLTPYVDKSEYSFIDPGNVYSSKKPTYNAYTGKRTPDSKYKYEKPNKEVTFRSAGFHIHIKFCDNRIASKIFEGIYAPDKTNELIKELDKVYDTYFPESLPAGISEKEELRTTKFAVKGDYRMKYHSQEPKGFTTLEYRQFSSAFFLLTPKMQTKILNKFAHVVEDFEKSLE